MDRRYYSMVVPAELASLEPVMAFLAELARAAGFEDSEAGNIRLALEEALSNTIIHGLGQNPEEPVDLSFQMGGEELTITIHEKGIPFDPGRVPEYVSPTSLDDASPAGLGTKLLKSFVDRVEFRSLGRDGKETILTKRLARPRVDQMGPIPAGPAPARPEGGGESAGEAGGSFSIRPPEPGEAIDVSRLAWRAYGYTYEDYIYYPERVRALWAQGRLVSLVLASDRGEIIGHVGLKFNRPGDLITEAGLAFIHPDFRRNRFFGDLAGALFQKAESLGVRGLFTRAATSHQASQRHDAKRDLIGCGILLGAFDSHLDFKSLAGPARQRESLVLAYLPFIRSPKKIHPPGRHRGLIEAIYRDLDLPVDILPGRDLSQADTARSTVLHSYVDDVVDVAMIDLVEMGPDVLQAVRGELHRHRHDRHEVIFLRLSLECPYLPRVAEVCESWGFFFAGILPSGLMGADALILQYLNNLDLDLSLVAPWSDTSTRVMAHVAGEKERADGVK